MRSGVGAVAVDDVPGGGRGLEFASSRPPLVRPIQHCGIACIVLSSHPSRRTRVHSAPQGPPCEAYLCTWIFAALYVD